MLVHACWLPDAPMARALDFQLLPDVPRASKVVVEGMCGLGQSLLASINSTWHSWAVHAQGAKNNAVTGALPHPLSSASKLVCISGRLSRYRGRDMHKGARVGEAKEAAAGSAAAAVAAACEAFAVAAPLQRLHVLQAGLLRVELLTRSGSSAM